MGCWFALKKFWSMVIIISFWVSSLRAHSATPVRMSLSRHYGVSGGENLSRLERLRIAIKRDAERFNAAMAASAAAASRPEREGKVVMSPVHPGTWEFLMDLSIGTPPVPLRSIMDTGSPLTWTQCLPCSSGRCFGQDTPIFDPKKSTSFHKYGCCNEVRHQPCRRNHKNDTDSRSCSYGSTYADESSTEGYVASETLTFEGNVSFHGVTFLCAQNTSGPDFNHTSGLVGLSRGRLSLVSQLNLSRFSYCLPDLESNSSTGTLVMGGSSVGGTTTPFARNPSSDHENSYTSEFYYVSVEGISVGKTRLSSVPKETFQLSRNGSGGMVIDSGTTLTYLPTAAFKAVAREVGKQLNLPANNSFDIPCFTLPKKKNNSETVNYPMLTLHLQGTHAGAATNLFLPEDNMFIKDEEEGLTCLAIGDAAGGGGLFGVLGNILQQNMMVTYDMAENTLSFKPTQCSGH